ncbi:MAG: transglutaminase domain-containing protein [Lachnospiraceae bacterium]|nr:transglutaminase domain-containing protein [Lachnospiraceae bacterium]
MSNVREGYTGNPVYGGASRTNTHGRRGHGRRRRKQRRRNKMLAIFGVLAVLVLFLVVMTSLHGRVEKTYTLEAGQEIDLSKLVSGKKAPVMVKDLTAEEKVTPGKYKMKVKLSPFTYTITVTVQDTTAPSGTAKELLGLYGEALTADMFVADMSDVTGVTASFVSQPDVNRAGYQNVGIQLKDGAGNTTLLETRLCISNLKRELVLEAGAPMPDAQAFLEEVPGLEDTQISYLTIASTIDTTVLGTQSILMLVDGVELTTSINVVDTVAPVITVKHVDGFVGKVLDPSAFVDGVTDMTDVTYSYAQEPDWSKEGSGSGRVTVTDASGNSTTELITYKLVKDTVAPEVSLSVIDIIIGEPVSYKKAVGYSDNADSKEELKLEIDNSKVDPGTVGTYKVIYTVTDTAGNSTTKEGTVKVLAEKPIYYDEDVVNAKADEVLASILKDGMTQYEQAKAIYNWVHSRIGYISHSEKGDMVRGAYEGLVDRRGDCFVYACTAKVLLTRAGIKNMDIVKSTVNPSHYWNLVDVGDGWYHFDATPRKDKTVFFMWTDAQLKEYSESHKNTHIYDASLYPEIN